MQSKIIMHSRFLYWVQEKHVLRQIKRQIPYNFKKTLAFYFDFCFGIENASHSKQFPVRFVYSVSYISVLFRLHTN